MHVSAHPRITAAIVKTSFRKTAGQHGIPASTLTDNGMVYTVRLAGYGRQGGRNAFEQQLRDWNLTQKNSRPNHPTTCGKAERFQQTMKKWLRAQPVQPSTIAELQTLLDHFTTEYNDRRPHRSLPDRATPATLYNAMPKAMPGPSTDAETHQRVRHDRVDKAGSVTLRHHSRLHHIGVGRTTPEPASSCSSRTSTSASSTPPPESSYASSSSIPTATTNPAEPRKDPPEDSRNEQHPDLHSQVRVSPMS